MQINNCLILAAGMGTRMGAIGKQLPKVLWPVFEKSLLELQVAYARSLGAEKIFINLHFMRNEIIAYCKERSAFEGVEFVLEEPEILDIGGAIHNIASKVSYKGNLLVLNADQFFYLKKDDLLQILKPYTKSPAVLFSYPVNVSSGYNGMLIGEDRLLKGIVKNKDLPAGETVETYTGISFINLKQLDPVPGKSAFFDSVCPFETKQIQTILLKSTDYWDFGTIGRYWNTCFRILETYRRNSNHPFLRFLVENRALKTWKVNLQKISYNARAEKIINLNEAEEQTESASRIIMEGKNQAFSEAGVILWKGIQEKIS